MLEITTPRAPQDWEAVRDILREYAASLDVDLCFQGFNDELMALPGQYAAPICRATWRCLDRHCGQYACRMLCTAAVGQHGRGPRAIAAEDLRRRELAEARG